ncbi:MAG: Coenzyme F420 hydrogenase/dehydrogenase, beta subunit C-terminal domain [Muribaculaceae bacterium]|nr:Coenzyme F420 hydrogenase/dehydrogenase, beta subunit C-terminal domain [Muribaculaceae bacterium]
MPINILRKEDCTGCGACIDCCPTSAISWNTDIEGFWQASVDHSKCIDCSLCEKICPLINATELNGSNKEFGNPDVLAAYNTDNSVRINSTSGGVFSAMASKVLQNGGFIGGAVWTDDFQARHILSDNPADLERIRGSKYFQSDATGLFKAVRKAVATGRPVLVCGTPCQIAGLKSFMRRDYDNLILVDFVCGNINSPKLFKKYIESLEQKYGAPMLSYHPKNKDYGGWHNFAFKATFENGRTYVRNRTKDLFTRCFIGAHIGSRPCCFECKFKKLPRVADISIGDFWGIENVDPSFDSPMGTSLVMLNNPKGRDFFNSLGSSVNSKSEPLEGAIAGNPHILHNSTPSKIDRNRFYELLDSRGFDYTMRKFNNLNDSLITRILRKLKRRL